MVKKLPELRTGRYRAQWRATVEKYAFPELGDMLVQDISRDDILRVLHPIWEIRTETATKVRQCVEKTLDYAKAAGYRTGDNPAAWRGNLELALSSPSKITPKENFPALQVEVAARWWTDLLGREGMGAMALRFQALTASRAGAARFASWDEIDFDEQLWTIQPGRNFYKISSIGKPHRMHLTDRSCQYHRYCGRVLLRRLQLCKVQRKSCVDGSCITRQLIQTQLPVIRPIVELM